MRREEGVSWEGGIRSIRTKFVGQELKLEVKYFYHCNPSPSFFLCLKVPKKTKQFSKHIPIEEATVGALTSLSPLSSTGPSKPSHVISLGIYKNERIGVDNLIGTDFSNVKISCQSSILLMPSSGCILKYPGDF
jgi:hypothetical protein